MTIEQLFRDDKSKRNGWSLRDTRIECPDRLDRLMLILALAYLLLCGIGLLARRLCKPAQWSSNSKSESCSVFRWPTLAGQWMGQPSIRSNVSGGFVPTSVWRVPMR